MPLVWVKEILAPRTTRENRPIKSKKCATKGGQAITGLSSSLKRKVSTAENCSFLGPSAIPSASPLPGVLRRRKKDEIHYARGVPARAHSLCREWRGVHADLMRLMESGSYNPDLYAGWHSVNRIRFASGFSFVLSDLFPSTLRRISSYARRFWFAAGAYGSRDPHRMIAALSEMLRDSPHGQELGPGIVDAAQSTVLPRERTNMRPFRMGTRTWPSSGGLGIRYFPPCSSPTVCRPPWDS